MLILILFILYLCSAFDEYDLWQDMYFLRTDPATQNLSGVLFPFLVNFQSNAKPATITQYPWMARVVHSKSNDYPVMCNAICVDKGVFVSAARCIFALKIKTTSILYKTKRLPVRAFVLPSILSSQAFDDVGFIVTEGMPNESYSVLQIFDHVKRTDDTFKWFEAKYIAGHKFKVVGYAVDKSEKKIKTPETEYRLTELAIVIGMDICSNFLRPVNLYHVPCYHSCSVDESKKKANSCNNYHGVEGSAVLDVNSNKLFGVATWGVINNDRDLPVGFCVLNSKAFYEDFQCAKKIRNADATRVKTGNYQNYCNK